MPVLHRWDENDDVVVKRSVWRRYDETESSNGSGGDSSEAEPPSWMRWNIKFLWPIDFPEHHLNSNSKKST